MRRISDTAENESMENARRAYDKYSKRKHSRGYVREYDAHLESNLEEVISMIADETWQPSPYREKTIMERKVRKLALACITDHVVEFVSILPYEKNIYDFSTWRAPAVKPGLGTHAMMRFLRNDLYRYSQEEMGYNVSLDIHHYFPNVDHDIMKDAIFRKVKDGKLRRFLFKVIDSYVQGIPLGIKIAQLFGQVYLAAFDRLLMRFFDIGKDPEKLAYWTRRYVEARIVTATSEDANALCRGPAYLADQFRRYVAQGVQHYYRFVDNILIIHKDKAALHMLKELSIMHLSRDWHCEVNKDYNVRPTWTGIKIVGYVFYHDHVECSKENKQRLAREVHKLQKRGFGEEQIRIALSSRIGYVKHADVINLLKSIGMNISLGKIIKSRKTKAPFEGMNGSQKVKFSTITNYKESKDPIKIMLIDYTIVDSKIDKNKVVVQVDKPDGSIQTVEKSEANKALAIRFKKILRTFVNGGEESYVFEKKKDENGNPTTEDAEYYSFTGSKILIDQAQNDFTVEDLPCPTVIQQFLGKSGQPFVKFT